ncbi:MAG: excinuclease ABC subunit C, partial [Opitutus sp.]|nr:excinuclease ABC subunit C [Opitutus sp.]
SQVVNGKIDLCELLHARGLPRSTKVKLVRHQSSEWSIPELIARGQFETYQSNQGRPIFNCEFIVSFLGERHAQARLLGVYRVENVTRDPARLWPSGYLYPEMRPGPLWYQLAKLPAFAALENRVVIDWGASPRMWHQWLKEREVIEVLPDGYVRDFPGYDEVVLNYAELQHIVAKPAAHREWHRALSSVAGVYLITDTRDGLQYVGSASGASGLLGRWSDYARTGHGGNKLLRQLIARDADAALHFQFSILRIMVPTTPRDDILKAESSMKRKLGSRAHGLNT